MQLNVTDITYDGKDIWDDNGVGMVLSSTESNLILVAGYAKDLYTAWADVMKTIPGITCTLTGDGDAELGQCTTTSTCEEIWPSMKMLTIQIDDIEYSLPP